MPENTTSTRIRFCHPHLTGNELHYIADVLQSAHLCGNGNYTKKCQRLLQSIIGCKKVQLTNSGTAALEMAAILADIKPGDEVIMPSFTFVSTANAFVLRGATPVFVDIRPDILGLDENLIEKAITSKTKAIVPVHYAGVGCEMDAIMSIANKHGLTVIEDAAHCIESSYRGTQLGAHGHLAALSFHETKNIVAGEAGALLINDDRFVERAEIIWEKGTNRLSFFEGKVDKYTWVDVGSSFLPSEITAACLLAQLEQVREITDARLKIWYRYHELFEPLESRGIVRRPVIPPNRIHNAHIYYLILPKAEKRSELLASLESEAIGAVFHYVPLHSSPAGMQFGRTGSSLQYTDDLSARLIRLPLSLSLTDDQVDRVAAAVTRFLTT